MVDELPFTQYFRALRQKESMSFVDSTHLMAQLADLRMNREDADVTLNCKAVCDDTKHLN